MQAFAFVSLVLMALAVLFRLPKTVNEEKTPAMGALAFAVASWSAFALGYSAFLLYPW